MTFTVWPFDWPEDARNTVAEWRMKYGEARDALEALVSWENYDIEYANPESRAEHAADIAHAKAVLAKHPRPLLDTGGKWSS